MQTIVQKDINVYWHLNGRELAPGAVPVSVTGEVNVGRQVSRVVLSRDNVTWAELARSHDQQVKVKVVSVTFVLKCLKES